MITFYFPPASTAAIFRILRFTKYLPALGFEPDILTVKKKYYDKKISFDYTIKVPNNINVYRSNMIGWIINCFRIKSCKNKISDQQTIKSKNKKKNSFKTFQQLVKAIFFLPDSQVWWVPIAILKALRINCKKKYDVIYTTGAPFSTHLIGMCLKGILKKPWIADFRDPWVSNPIIKWKFKSIKNIIKKMEQKVLENADAIVTTTEALVDDFKKRYPDISPEKYHVITNGYDSEDFKNIDIVNYEKFTIVYTGVLYSFHSLTPFLIALNKLFELRKEIRNHIQVVIIGPFNSEHVNEVGKNNLNDVVFLKGLMPHNETIKYIIAAHLLLVTLTTDEDKSLFIPGKIFEYLGSGRPILSISPEGELADIVRRNSAGIVIAPKNIRGISEAISLFYDEYLIGNYKGRDKGSIEIYDAKNLTNMLSKVINDIIQKKDEIRV